MNLSVFRVLLCVAILLPQVPTTYAQKEVGRPVALPPIRLGAISTLSGGPAEFDTVGKAVRAYLSRLNASGGIGGRQVELIEEDDKGDPRVAAALATKLIERDQVVAQIGGASLLECAVNAKAYAAVDLVSIPGLALDASCFRSPQIAPVNAGPYAQLTVALRFASDHLKAQRVCVFRMGVPAPVKQALDAEMVSWGKRGSKPVLLDVGDVQYADSPLMHLQRAVDARCDALVFAGPAPVVAGFAKAARKVSGTPPALIFLGAAYTKQMVEQLGADGEGIYAMSEFEPWSSRSGALSDWRELMTRNKVPLTSSSQGGYVAAQVIERVLRSIKGEINRQSVSQAFRALERYDSPMLGVPFKFGNGQTHHPNRAVIPVRLVGGSWRIAHHEWLIVD